MPRAIFQEVMKAKDKQIYIPGTKAKDKKSEDNVKGKESEAKNQSQMVNEKGDTIRKYSVKVSGGLQAIWVWMKMASEDFQEGNRKTQILPGG